MKLIWWKFEQITTTYSLLDIHKVFLKHWLFGINEDLFILKHSATCIDVKLGEKSQHDESKCHKTDVTKKVYARMSRPICLNYFLDGCFLYYKFFLIPVRLCYKRGEFKKWLIRLGLDNVLVKTLINIDNMEHWDILEKIP